MEREDPRKIGAELRREWELQKTRNMDLTFEDFCEGIRERGGRWRDMKDQGRVVVF